MTYCAKTVIFYLFIFLGLNLDQLTKSSCLQTTNAVFFTVLTPILDLFFILNTLFFIIATILKTKLNNEGFNLYCDTGQTVFVFQQCMNF